MLIALVLVIPAIGLGLYGWTLLKSSALDVPKPGKLDAKNGYQEAS